MLKKLVSLFFAALLLAVFSSCQSDDGLSPDELALDTGPAFLLVEETDELGLANDHAFLMDGAGPIYFKVLDLTEEQREQIREIAAGYKDDFRALHGNWRNGSNWEEIRAQRRALKDSMRAEIFETVLTADQQAIVTEIENDFANGVYPQIIVDHRVANYTELLALTADQQTAFTDLISNFGQQMLDARNSGVDHQTLRETMRALFEELDAQITALLDETQLEIYNAWKAERERHRPGHFRGGGPKGPRG